MRITEKSTPALNFVNFLLFPPRRPLFGVLRTKQGNCESYFYRYPCCVSGVIYRVMKLGKYSEGMTTLMRVTEKTTQTLNFVNFVLFPPRSPLFGVLRTKQGNYESHFYSEPLFPFRCHLQSHEAWQILRGHEDAHAGDGEVDTRVDSPRLLAASRRCALCVTDILCGARGVRPGDGTVDARKRVEDGNGAVTVSIDFRLILVVSLCFVLRWAFVTAVYVHTYRRSTVSWSQILST